LARKKIDSAGRKFTSPHSAILVFHLDGAINRVDPIETAASGRDARYIVNIAGAWENKIDNEREVKWVRDTWAALRPFGTGAVYVISWPKTSAQNGCTPPTERRFTNGWRHSRTATIRIISSGQTRTFARPRNATRPKPRRFGEAKCRSELKG